MNKMQIKKIILICILFLLSCDIYADENDKLPQQQSHSTQKLDIFTLDYIEYLENESAFYFTSLSENITFDNYDENGEVILPRNLQLIPDTVGNYKKDIYILNKEYRQRFMEATGIAETDTYYLYDYQNNQLTTYSISELEVIAIIDAYSMDEKPCKFEDYYQFGFRLTSSQLPKALDPDSYQTLVYIGKENPFALQQLTALDWKKIDNEDFPIISGIETSSKFIQDSFNKTYQAKANGWNYYVQDHFSQEIDINSAYYRQVVIKDQGEAILFNSEYAFNDEIIPAFLNDQHPEFQHKVQWSGKLFKNQPLVIFGFEWKSFGCPVIDYIDRSYKSLIIKCDNRH